MPGKYWEPKLSALLKPPLFSFVHKCPDARHGGQAKIDFIVLSSYGILHGIEVKWIQTKQYTFHTKEVTPLQAVVLDAIAAGHGKSWVAVGYNKESMWFFDWKDLQTQSEVDLHSANFSLQLENKPTSEYLWLQLHK